MSSSRGSRERSRSGLDILSLGLLGLCHFLLTLLLAFSWRARRSSMTARLPASVFTRFPPGLVDLFVLLLIRSNPCSRLFALFVAAAFKSPVLPGDSVDVITQLRVSEYFARRGMERCPDVASWVLQLGCLDRLHLSRGEPDPGCGLESPIFIESVRCFLEIAPSSVVSSL